MVKDSNRIKSEFERKDICDCFLDSYSVVTSYVSVMELEEEYLDSHLCSTDNHRQVPTQLSLSLSFKPCLVRTNLI